jgi:hypothetical protein
MTAGVAAAEVSISGTAGVAAVKSGDATARMTSGVDLNFAVSAAADNGLTMAATVDLGEGELVDYNDDFAVDSQCTTVGGNPVARAHNTAGDGVDAATTQNACVVGSSASPAVTLGYAGVTVVVDAGGVDDLYDDAQHDDISINMDLGGLDTTITMDTDAADSHGSYKVAYTMGDLTATLTGSTDPGDVKAAPARAESSAGAGDALAARAAGDNSGAKLALAYTMGDLTLNASTNDNGKDKSTNDAGFSYAMDAITITYTLANTAEEGWKDYDAKLAYSAGAMTASIATDEEGVSKVIAEYDLGGGATFFASSKSTKGTNNQQAAGINFKF